MAPRVVGGASGRVDASLEARLVGRSPAMCAVRERLRALSRLCVPVLIVGEAGSGRDSAAAALHALGQRGNSQLVTIRCGARLRSRLPPRGGSVYLDEVGRLSPAEQTRWLAHLGLRGEAGRPRVASVCASTSEDLGSRVRTGSFSAELVEYLERHRVWLPPLRDRRRDVPDLVRSLARSIGSRLGRPIVGIDEGALALLAAQPWTGNVAELAGVLEKLIAYSESGEITLEALADVLDDVPSATGGAASGPGVLACDELLAVVDDCGGNLAAAARRLGLKRSTLVSRARRLGLLPRSAAR